MKKYFLNLLILVFLTGCKSDESAYFELNKIEVDNAFQGLFVHELRANLPNNDTSFIFFRTMTQDKSVFMEIYYNKRSNEKSSPYLYTKDFFGKTIDSSRFTTGVYAIGNPYCEVHKDRSVTLIDSQKIMLEPYWVEIKTQSGERVSVMCQTDTTICCDTVIFNIDLDGKITCSNPLVKNPIMTN
ncbi:MAG: hypothetical protein IPM74_18365 [Crocinitomicaceae bacterium]|nr:hypothetical protein [Crocinitomicaceae bacterium]MBK8927808.1 hypothetical protein [Crocinitomicaceae bacterium]